MPGVSADTLKGFGDLIKNAHTQIAGSTLTPLPVYLYNNTLD